MPTLESLREEAAACRNCGLYEHATQTVFGEGPGHTRVMLVGEVPGDREDREGQPFVGPAGRELDRGLEAAGLPREEAYVTNVVKHFRFTERGKRRIHQRPRRSEIEACLPWLRAELDAVAPEAIVLLGATAGQALLGSSFRLGENRGRPLETDLADLMIATAHPSAIVRERDDAARHAARAAFVADLRGVAGHLGLG